MSFDPQFLVVTLAALWGGWILLRPLLRWRSEKKTGACGRCSSPGCAADAAPKGSGLVTLGSGSRPSREA
jgi:hypothetical protein